MKVEDRRNPAIYSHMETGEDSVSGLPPSNGDLNSSQLDLLEDADGLLVGEASN